MDDGKHHRQSEAQITSCFNKSIFIVPLMHELYFEHIIAFTITIHDKDYFIH